MAAHDQVCPDPSSFDGLRILRRPVVMIRPATASKRRRSRWVPGGGWIVEGEGLGPETQRTKQPKLVVD